MGGTSVTNVTHVGGGIDWDAGKFFIWPEKKMIEAAQEPIKDWRMKANYVWMLMFIRDCYSIYPKHI